MAVLRSAVPMLPRVTDAPGIAALVASMTVPTIAPYEVCARTGVRLPIKSAAAITQPAAKWLYRSIIGSSSSYLDLQRGLTAELIPPERRGSRKVPPRE